MTTAIDKWGQQQEVADRDDDSHVDQVMETDITGGDGFPNEESGQDESAVSTAAEDTSFSAKKAKDKKIMIFAGVSLVVMVLGFVGLLVLNKSKDVSAPPQSDPPQSSAPLHYPVAQQQAEISPVLAPVAIAPIAQAVDLGGSATTSPPPESIAASSGTGVVSNQLATPAINARDDSATKATAVLRAEIEALNTDISNKDKLISDLRKELAEAKEAKVQAKPVAATSKAHPVAAPKKVVKPVEKIIIERAPRVSTNNAGKKPAEEKVQVVVDPQILKEPKQTPTSPRAALKGGKVRSEFSVYAISNGRAWVTWSKDGVNYTVGANSELPDNSKVTSIDDINGIVFTTAGEIHAKPPTR